MPARILWWGRFDPEYSRNRILRSLLLDLGYSLCDFRPKSSPLGRIEACFVNIPEVQAIWVPAFRHRDFPAARRFARSRGIPLIFDPLISSWDKVVFERKKYGSESAKALRLQREERSMFAAADLLLADTAAHAEFFARELGARPERTRIVLLGAEESIFTCQADPLPATPLEVLFYGSFIGLQAPEVMVEAALLVPSVSWTFIGDGPLLEQCQELAKGYPHIHFDPWLPYHELPARIGQASIVLGVFGQSAKAGRVIANKVYQGLACGRPIITRQSAAFPSELENQAESGIIFIPPGDPGALAQAVSTLAAEPGLLAAARLQARATYKKWFSMAGIKRSLQTSLQSLGL